MELLERLTQTPSVPGREARIREVIIEHLQKHQLVDEMHVDAMGSLLTVRRPRGDANSADGPGSAEKPTKVMLAAHMDQIGFLVSHIHSDGFLRVNPVGGFDPRNLFARKVRVCSRGGDLMGVMNPGGKPIHISSPDERKKVPELGDFFIDLGLSGDQVKEQVQLGDMVVLDGPFHEVGAFVGSQCLDNRVGCWAQLRALERLESHACEIHAVWTVQEEVGLRGATPASYQVEPDISIACDTTLCCQTPGVPEEKRVSVAGGGVALHVMDSSAISDITLIETMEQVAADRKISVQRALLPRGGQDGAAMQRARTGSRMVAMACPIKYIHTVTEMAHRDDLEAYVALLAAYLETI